MFATGAYLGVLAHLVGDYLTQTHWMAREKGRRWVPALVHGAVYGAPFAIITLNVWALLVIAGSHAMIDHYGLARYIVWAKNQLAPGAYRQPWAECRRNGYAPDQPEHLTDWLTIIADNTIHVLINTAALWWVL